MKILKGYSKILAISIIAFWLVMMGLLVKRTYFNIPEFSQPPALADIDKADLILGEEWMGIYMGKDKIGYSVTNIQKGNDIYLVSERTLMRLNVMGTPQEITILTNAILGRDFSIKSFRFDLQSGVVKFHAQAKVNETEMELYIHSGGRNIRKEIPLKTTPYLPGSLRLMLLQQGLTVGKEFRVPIFDPSTMSNEDIVVKIEGKERLKIGNESILAYRLKESFRGLVVRSWISEEGKTLKEESPMGMVMVKETKEEALTKNWGRGTGTDIILSTAVPVNIRIENPKLVKYLKVRLRGIPLSDFNLTSGRQVLKGDILEITREETKTIKTYFLPLKERGFEEHLKPSHLVQSNDAKIIEEAKRIVGNEKDALKAAKRIMEWVYQSIDKKPTISIPSALEVLESKVGDCNEHTTLFTALTRAVGIPTRIITGIVLSDNNFYYHAWAEVYVGKWLSLDPTMDQFPADATHIGFVEGELDKQVEMMKVIGHLKAEILEHK
ncbi:MAG: transglutaminase-like domain-containing protein [Thermodesulfobacteriota bacterium]